MIFIAFFTQICEAPLEEASNCHDWEKGCEIVLSWHVFSHTREWCSLTNQQKHTVSDWAPLGLQYTKGFMVCFVTNIEWSIFNWNLFYGYNVLESPKEQGIHYTRITKKNIPLIQDTQLPHTKEILYCDPLDKHWRTMPSQKSLVAAWRERITKRAAPHLSTSKMLACKCEGFLADFRASYFF